MDTLLISPHLSLREFIHSAGHASLNPENTAAWVADPQVRANALRLAVDVFEPARALLGPLRVNSGFRCPALNAAVGGAGTVLGQKPSAHMDGRAIDVFPLETTLIDAMYKLIESGIPYEKVIFERGAWIHLQVPKHAERPARTALMWFGGASYPAFNATDPRVRRVA